MNLLVISEANIASSNIGNFLNESLPSSTRLERTQKNVLELDYLADYQPKPDLVVVASSHKSSAGIPMLSAHPTGNWASADLGGKPKTLSIAPALYLANAIRQLKDVKERYDLNYEVGLEVTHHSPTIDLPLMFVEVGSTEKQWRDTQACRAVAQIIKSLLKEVPEKEDVCAGFGGPHYAPLFSRRVLAGKFAVGHICPQHHIDDLDETMILQAIKQTLPKPDFAALDWKGLKAPQREKLIEVLEKNKINWEKL